MEDCWSETASLINSRAYASVTVFNEKHIYLFGGLDHFSALDKIERYDIMLDKWFAVKLKLPKKIAKLGIAKLNDSAIMICGGIYGNEDNEYSYLDECHRLDFKTMTLSSMPPMQDKRILCPFMPVLDGKIFALGG